MEERRVYYIQSFRAEAPLNEWGNALTTAEAKAIEWLHTTPGIELISVAPTSIQTQQTIVYIVTISYRA